MSARFARRSVISTIDDPSFIPRTIDAHLVRRVALTPSRRASGTFRRRL
jgi:hypothetical protein